jgi:hypothetical protein
MTAYFIVSVNHTLRENAYITFWRADNSGYAWPLSWAGEYPEARVLANLGYYNGGGNIAVPVEVVRPLAIAPAPGRIDGDAGPVVLNNRANWDVLKANVIRPTRYPIHAEYKGARRQKEAA